MITETCQIAQHIKMIPNSNLDMVPLHFSSRMNVVFVQIDGARALRLRHDDKDLQVELVLVCKL